MAPSSSFTFETPSPTNPRATRTRPRNAEFNASPEDASSKSGRSLRKRTRVDYSFDQGDDDEGIVARGNPLTTRSSKKRRTDFSIHGDEMEDDPEPPVKRRASEQTPKPAPRRSQGRKSTVEPQPFVADHQDEDVPVQDTIEVGGHQSEASDESFHQRTNSDASHHEPLAAAVQTTETWTEAAAEDRFLDGMASVHNEAKPKSSAGVSLEKVELAVPKIEAQETSFDVPSFQPKSKAEARHEWLMPSPMAPISLVVEERPVGNEPIQHEPAQEQPVEKPSVEKQPVEGQSVADQPIADQPVADQPVEGQPADNQPVENQPAEDQPTKGQPSEDQRAEDQPAENQLVEDRPAKDQPTEDQPAEDRLAEDHLAEDQRAGDQPVKAQPAQDQPIEDQPDDHKSVEDKPVEDKLVKDEAVELKPVEQAHAEGTPVIEEPVEAKPAPAEPAEDEQIDPYAYLSAYIEGEKVLYPLAQGETEPATEQADPVETVELGSFQEAAEDAAGEELVDDQAEVPEDTPTGTPVPPETRANSPAAETETPEIRPPVKKHFAFKKARPASEFTDLFEDIDSLSPIELYNRLAAVNDALVAWQDEYMRLRKITDDEDNAIRHQAEEAAFLHRQKMATSKDPDANPLRKDFVVKGIRAPKPDPMVAYARQQDRILANAYLFEYDDRDSKVGVQDPLAQRRGAGKTRLRDRPKQTAKAAEADDANVVQGKRSRKPPNVYGDVENASRSSTPIPSQPQPRRRRGGRPPAEENGDGHLAVPNSQAEPVVEETPKKRNRGGRPRKHPLPTAIPENAPAAPEAEAEAEQDEPEERPSRKRRRKTFHDETFVNGTNGTAPASGRGRRRNSRMSEQPSGSFYSNSSMHSAQGQDDSRPATSSSTATASSLAVSTYGLREKRQTKFSLDDDDDDDFVVEEEEQPKPKRARRASKKAQGDHMASVANGYVAVPKQQEPSSASAPKVHRIKIKNFNGSSAAGSVPAHAPTSNPLGMGANKDSVPAQGNGDGVAAGNNSQANAFDPHRDYSTMTKSEKMSHSMKGKLPPHRCARSPSSGLFRPSLCTLAD